MSDVPLVTVLIPARNEEADIGCCLRAVRAQDYTHDRMEIVLVDGGSTDRTVDVVEQVLGESVLKWKVVDNPACTTPSSLNAGLAAVSGQYVCRVDARSIIPPHYVRRCAEILAARPDVAVIGGSQSAIARDASVRSVGIARALNNRYTMGGSRYRSGAPSGPADTVYLGSFRTAQLRLAGGWDEYFQTNQDYELNRRIGQDGVVWFESGLEVGYIPRSSVSALWRQYLRFGRWKVRYWRRTSDSPQRRQWAALAGIPVVLASGIVYLGRPGPRRSRWVVAGVGAVSALATVERAGGPRDETPWSARIYASIALLAVIGGWWTGTVREFFTPRHRRS